MEVRGEGGRGAGRAGGVLGADRPWRGCARQPAVRIPFRLIRRATAVPWGRPDGRPDNRPWRGCARQPAARIPFRLIRRATAVPWDGSTPLAARGFDARAKACPCLHACIL
eukprot:16610-Chlamydomonas_euryale.AAC.19